MFKKDKNKKSEKARLKAEAEVLAKINAQRESFQEFLPIKDIKNGCFIDSNGFYYPVLVLGTINSDLMSNDQKELFVQNLEIALGSLNCDEYQILLIPMPYDISIWQRNNNDIMDNIIYHRNEANAKLSDKGTIKQYTEEIRFLEQQQKQLETRSKILKDANDFVVSKLQSGRMTTKKSFMIPYYKGCIDIKVAIENAKDTLKRLNNNNIYAYLASEQELRDMLYVIFNPLSAEITKVARNVSGPLFIHNTEKDGGVNNG